MALYEQEEEILNKFKRQAHQYLSHIPAYHQNLEWLSLIQHHGGPTRLLDFTRSFYVATFFALETATDEAVVWAINQSALDSHLLHLFDLVKCATHKPSIRTTAKMCVENSISYSLPPDMFEECKRDTHFVIQQPFVIAVKPWQLNQRMIIQQGWFLFPTSLTTSFEHNFCKTFNLVDKELPVKTPVKTVSELKKMVADPKNNLAMIKMVFPRELHLKIMSDLHKMNITAATLFPGLDGFARSLQFSLRIFDNLAKEIQ